MTLKSTATATVLPWGSFSVTTSGRHVTTRVEVAEVRLSEDPRGSKDFWVAERTERDLSGQGGPLWADSRTCPALVPAMARLASLEPIRITPPGAPARELSNVILDGSAYEVAAQGVYPAENAGGGVRLTGNVDTPVARWVDDTLSALKPCWSASPPV